MATPPLPAPLLLDTNVLIYHIRLALTDDVTQQLGEALKAGRAFISVITRIEMLAWKGHSDESLRQTTDLISLLPELPMSEAVIEQAIRIRKTFGLKLPDAVIAATALAHGLQLMTANESDFKRVVGLELLCI
jgi:predicted nucleic acid-binding protein